MNINEVLNANEPNATWRAEARILMEQKKSFAVINWEYSEDSTALAKEFDYNYGFNHKLNRASFYPRNSN